MEKSSEVHQLFYGIDNNRLFFQIADRTGTIKYSFESNILDMVDKVSTCRSIMEACCEMFQRFEFPKNLLLSRESYLTVRRHGLKIIDGEINLKQCESLTDLPAFGSWLFLESFLPFEKC